MPATERGAAAHVVNDARAEDARRRAGDARRKHDLAAARVCRVRRAYPDRLHRAALFAGFSGGGKAVMPGPARLTRSCINHRAAHIDDSRARWGITDGNPLWEDDERTDGPEYVFNNVTPQPRQADHAVFVGIREARAGCAYCQRGRMRGVPEPFDVVITSNSGYPLDLNVPVGQRHSAAAQVVHPAGRSSSRRIADGLPDHG